MVVALHGDLGSGKTTLVRGVLHARGWIGSVKSPTYTLVEHYAFSSLYFYHFDFYRFADPGEWETAGLADCFRSDSICLVEWPERVAGLLPPADLDVVLTHARRPTVAAVSW
jgi:tRNA threonylcarbamoyladenosine biosynthesis protein TsaE